MIFNAAAVLLGFAAILKLLPYLLLPLHIDIVFVLEAARNLLKDGNLQNAGLSYAFQWLRPGAEMSIPFFLPYLLPVYYYATFFKIFGASDVAFYLGQAALLLGLSGILARGFRLGYAGSNFVIGTGILTGTIAGSIYRSPTQLMAIVLTVYFWELWDQSEIKRPAFVGALLAASFSCRPEPVFLGMLAILRGAFCAKDARERYRTLPIVGLTALSVAFVISLSRHWLGSDTDRDPGFLLLMGDVIKPGPHIFGVSQFPSFSDFFSDPTLRHAFIQKIVRNIKTIMGPGSMIWGRSDSWLLVLPFLLSAAGISRMRRYVPAFLLLLFQILMYAVSSSLARYYDISLFVLLVASMGDCWRWVECQSSNRQRATHRILLLVAAGWTAHSLAGCQVQFEDALRVRRDMLRASEAAHQLVPSNAFVISDQLPLWVWYGGGRMGCFAPVGNPETMQRLLKKFPQAYMVLFLGDQKLEYSVATLGRPLLSSADHVWVYGPERGSKSR